MAEDIDIEEHDLLQNPIIQKIFPDLSVLKQEIMDYNEDLPDKAPNLKGTDKNILNNDLETTNNINVSGTNMLSNCALPYQSKIILGSKPSKGTKNMLSISDLKVMLKNIGPYLTRTKRFCEKCLILFPNKWRLNNHKFRRHTILECNYKKKDPFFPGYNKRFKCSLCHAEYTMKSNLRRHERNMHSIYYRKTLNKNIAKQTIEGSVVDKPFDLQTNYVVRKTCFHCNKLFPNQQDLIDHLYAILYAQKAQVTSEYIEKKELPPVENPINKNSNILINVNLDAKQKQLENLLTDKPLYLLCKFCDSEHDNILSYNNHLRQNHKNEMINSVDSILSSYNNETNNFHSNNELLSKNSIVDTYPRVGCLNKTLQNSSLPIYTNVQVMVSKIILFKCLECNVYFLTSDAASNHFEHLRSKVHWECTTCNRLFKCEDAKNHQRQHQYSDYFVIIKVHADVQPTVLYKCSRCAVHFSKEKIYEHCSICESELSRSRFSSYCNVCDIFVESNIKLSHDNDHCLRNLMPSDIKIIDSELHIVNKVKSHRVNYLDDPYNAKKSYLKNIMLIHSDNSTNKNVGNKCRNDLKISHVLDAPGKKQLSYNFCNVCKCNICRVFKTDVHLKSLCVNIVKYICKYCGLLFSNKSIASHKKLHQQYKTLKLQDFKFYNLQTNKLIKPLVPEFPKCELCENHFISKVEVKGHLCDINDYYICPICKTKFSETAYKLHMPFHTYKLKCKNKQSDKLFDDIQAYEDRNDIIKNTSCKKKAIPIIYTCKNCSVSLSTYDDVIEHCHLHTNLNKIEVNCIECAPCQLKFDNSSFNTHVELHNVVENIKFTRFNFDVSYFGSDKWLKHMFKAISKSEMNELIEDSIYKYETRIKMEVVQVGPSNLTIYKCEKCQCTIDSNSTYSHIVTCCPNSEISNCTFCDLSFACSITRDNHEKIHAIPEITINSYRIVIFNREQDRNINRNISNFKKCFVVYECRFCHVLVDNYNYVYHVCFRKDCKKCNVCGLLIGVENWDEHISKHKRIPSFNENKIKVVLLGNKSSENKISQRQKVLLPTFNGIVCDYTFYKCNDCEVCVRDERNTVHHSCLIDAAKSQCTKCDLIFDEGKLKGHLKLHDTDPDFTKDSIQLIPFTNRKTTNNVVKSKKILAVEFERNGKNFSDSNLKDITQVRYTDSKIVKLYKCSCGLHYVQLSSLQEHKKKCFGKNRSKQSIQNCSKCGLSFTSDILFRHLLDHHGDKNVIIKYEIVVNPSGE